MLSWLNSLRNVKQTPDRAGLCISHDSISLVQANPASHTDAFSLTHSLQAATNSPEQALELLKNWVSELGLQHAGVILTLEQEAFELIQMDKPDVPDADLKAATHWKLQEYLEYPVTEAISDIFEVPEGRHGHSNQLFVAVARRSLLEKRIKLIRDAGLKPTYIDIAQLAMRNLIEGRLQTSDTVGIVHFHPNDSRLYICRNSQFYITRVINLGLNSLITDDEMQQLQLVDQFSLEVQRTMDYYDSHFGQSPVRQLHFVDRSGQLNWLPDAVTNMLGIKASRVDMPQNTNQQNLVQPDQAPLAWGGLIGRLNR
ncbi:pilus assembly protein PilM [Nitrincola iocasae]|uniref:pilus assembly protein PilM n=1 Tax=Nitrincola iocasae TaxID=2614693 RepID=UPI00178106CE|nr:pilus assembly protein PilM [Nitrincola iocasae]